MRVSQWSLVALLAATVACSGSSEQTKDDGAAATEKPAGDESAATTGDGDAPAQGAEEEAAPAEPEVDLDAVEDLSTLFSVTGSVDHDQVQGIIGQGKDDVYKCYGDALPDNPGMTGRVLVSITATPSGDVASAIVKQTTLNKPEVERCMVTAIRDWKFPADANGGLVIIKYAFQLPP